MQLLRTSYYTHYTQESTMFIIFYNAVCILKLEIFVLRFCLHFFETPLQKNVKSRVFCSFKKRKIRILEDSNYADDVSLLSVRYAL